MTRKEHETNVTYDYYANKVRFYTTRKGEWTKLKERLKPVWDEVEVTKRRERETGEVLAWDLVIPMEFCSGYMARLTKTANRLAE